MLCANRKLKIITIQSWITVLTLFTLITFIDWPNNLLGNLSFMPLITIGSLCLYYYGSIVQGSLKKLKIVFIISYSSFCMYLFHRPVYVLLTWLYYPDGDIPQLLYLYLICMPVIIIFSYYEQKLYDQIIKKLAKYKVSNVATQ
jgi:peptidoglycan/LPS O-acetylase OafA/YrhL